MALEKQNLSISFSKGVDTKTDNKQVVPGKLLNLENAVLKKVGKFVKRFGYGVIANNFGLSKGNALATFKNELVAYDGAYLYSYAQAGDRLYTKGDKVAVDIATQSVARNSYEQTNPDCAYHSSGVSVFAWEDSSGGVRYSVFDVATQQTIVSNSALSGTGTKPKVLTIDDYVLIFFLDGTNLKYIAIDTTTPSLLGAEVTVGTGCVGYYDVKYFNSLMYVAFATGSTASIFTLNSALVQSGVLTVSATPSCLGIFSDTSNNFYCIYNEVNSVKYFVYNSSLSTQILGPTVIETGTAPFVNVTGYTDGPVGYVYYEVTGDIPSNQYIKTVNLNTSGVLGTPVDFLRSVGLYSKVFKNSDNRFFLTVTHQSDLQPTYFVVDVSGKVASKIAPALGGGLATTGLLAEVNEISTDNFLMAYEYKDFVQSVGGDVTTQTGINSVTLKYGQPILNEEIGNNLHSSGGVISSYDSQTVNELGFHLYPENINVSYEKNGGSLGEGIYSYAATYEWTDSQGQIHRSAPFYETLRIENNNQYFSVNPNTTTMGASLYTFYFQTNTTPTFDTGNLEDSLQNIYIGKKISIPNYVTGYVTGISDLRLSPSTPADFVRVYFTGYINTFTSGIRTATGLPQYGYIANSTIGSEQIQFSETNFLSFAGYVNAGSNEIYLNNTKGMFVGMRLFSSNSAFTTTVNIVTAVYDDRVVISNSATNTRKNSFFHFFHPLYGPPSGTVSSFTYNSNIYGPMNYFVNQKVYRFTVAINATSPDTAFTSITGITNIGSGLYTITLATSLDFAAQIYAVGLFPTGELFEKESATMSASFSNPVTITELFNSPAQISNKNVVLNKEATTTGSTELIVDAFASPGISVDTLRITGKDNAVINLYRTTKNGNVYYQVTPVNGIINDKTVDELTIVDGVPDEVLIGNQQLYTTGGEVENIAPPAGDVIGTFKNRLLVVPNEDPLSFWYSKQVRVNTPIEFNDSFVQRVPEKGGAITALQQMDDKLIIFKQDYVFVMVGDGPSVSGVNNDFTDPQLITADAGCLDKKSVVVLPTGLIYKSQKGFYLLDRALNVKYIGADVESFNSLAVTSAIMNEKENQVRFTLESGDALVYDYYVEQWAVFKDIDGVDAVNFQDQYTYLVPTGEIRKENTAFTDDGDFIPMKIETGWLNLAGLQNYQRIYHIMLVGTYKSPHTLQVQLYRDFIETPFETVTIPVATAPTKYQYRIFPSIQKCESIKIKITELQSVPYGEGFDISAINIELGVKRGQNKLSPDESYG